jgi:hypothetical protein
MATINPLKLQRQPGLRDNSCPYQHPPIGRHLVDHVKSETGQVAGPAREALTPGARATPPIDSVMRSSHLSTHSSRTDVWLKSSRAVFAPATLLHNTAGQVGSFLSQADEQPGAAAVG